MYKSLSRITSSDTITSADSLVDRSGITMTEHLTGTFCIPMVKTKDYELNMLVHKDNAPLYEADDFIIYEVVYYTNEEKIFKTPSAEIAVAFCDNLSQQK